MSSTHVPSPNILQVYPTTCTRPMYQVQTFCKYIRLHVLNPCIKSKHFASISDYMSSTHVPSPNILQVYPTTCPQPMYQVQTFCKYIRLHVLDPCTKSKHFASISDYMYSTHVPSPNIMQVYPTTCTRPMYQVQTLGKYIRLHVLNPCTKSKHFANISDYMYSTHVPSPNIMQVYPTTCTQPMYHRLHVLDPCTKSKHFGAYSFQ